MRKIDISSTAAALAQYEETDEFLRIILPAKRNLWESCGAPLFLPSWCIGIIFLFSTGHLSSAKPTPPLIVVLGICLLVGAMVGVIHEALWQWTGREFFFIDKDYMTVGDDRVGQRRSYTCRRSEVRRAYQELVPPAYFGFWGGNTAPDIDRNRKYVLLSTQEKELRFGLGVSESEAWDITHRINDWLKRHP